MEILFYLIAGHFFGDYVLQTDLMARLKNQWETENNTGVPWYYWMTAHSMTQGILVGLITGIWWLGALETLAHFAIDCLKCDKKIGIHADQALHITCKIIWFILALPLFLSVN